jgi:hypothetical protein
LKNTRFSKTNPRPNLKRPLESAETCAVDPVSRGKPGPKTRKGRARSSKNGIKHGILSDYPVVVTMETFEEWVRHRDGIVDNIAPVGALELELAKRLATVLWRLRRVIRYETALITHQVAETKADLMIAHMELDEHGKVHMPEPSEGLVAAFKEARFIVTDSAEIAQVIKYEAHLHRQCLQLLHGIEALQAQRTGRPMRLARRDISAHP